MNKHPHSKCHEFLGSLSEYIDGDLDPVICRELEEHMANCENCRIVVDTLRKTVTLYHRIAGDTSEVSAGMREKLFHTLNLDEFLTH